MSKPKRTKPTKAELAESYRILELQEFRMMAMVASYESLHGLLPTGLFESVIRETTAAQRSEPTDKQGVYARMMNAARSYTLILKAKEIQNRGGTSTGSGLAPSLASNPSIEVASALDLQLLGPYRPGK